MSFFNFCNFCNHEEVETPDIVVSSMHAIFRDANEHGSGSFEKVGDSTAMIKKSKYDQYLQQCKKKNAPFTDQEFPPNEKSLNYKIEGRNIVWKRISEIQKDAVMVEEGIVPADIQQGKIGDCYFLASISALAGVPARIEAIFFENFEVNGFGIYKLIVNFEGVLTEVVIDDYIPVFSTSNRPVFCKPKGREIWVMLIEKAWAKIKGSYRNIQAGCPHEVLNTFSVAPCQHFDLHEHIHGGTQNFIWGKLLHACQLRLPICVGTKPVVTLVGIKPQHTYTLLDCGDVPSGNKMHQIMRLRNPWGNTEYSGQASEDDTEFWKGAPTECKKKLMPAPESDDGDFSIPFSEFLKQFDSIDVSMTQPNFSYEFDILKMRRREPLFISLSVQEHHEAFITIEKIFTTQERTQQADVLTHSGYLRMIIAEQIDSQTYHHLFSRIETTFPDLSINCPKLKHGRYMIMVDADFPREEFTATFSYYFSTLASAANKHHEVFNDISQEKYVPFMEAVFKDYSTRTIGDKVSIGPRPGDWVRTTFLLELGGYGFVMCNLQEDTPIRLQISIDRGVIEANGFELIGHYDDHQTLEAGKERLVLFSYQFASKSVGNIQFPPPGFKISRIV